MKDVELTEEMLDSILKIGEVEEMSYNEYSFATFTTDRIFLLSEDFKTLKEVEDYVKNTDDYCEVILCYNKNTEKCTIDFFWSERDEREYNLVGKCVEPLKELMNELIEEANK